MANYHSGRDFEWKVRDHLQENGYLVRRMAGSKTKTDLSALKQGQALEIQCKRDGRCTPAERAELLRTAAMLPAYGVPIVAYREKVGPRFEIRYRRLTGLGPKDWEPWTPDEVGAPAS